MRLTALVLNPDRSNVLTLRSNRETDDLLIGVIHEETNQMLTILVQPNGYLTATYATIGDRESRVSASHHIGQFNEDGTLELVEPVPLMSDG